MQSKVKLIKVTFLYSSLTALPSGFCSKVIKTGCTLYTNIQTFQGLFTIVNPQRINASNATASVGDGNVITKLVSKLCTMDNKRNSQKFLQENAKKILRCMSQIQQFTRFTGSKTAKIHHTSLAVSQQLSFGVFLAKICVKMQWFKK